MCQHNSQNEMPVWSVHVWHSASYKALVFTVPDVFGIHSGLCLLDIFYLRLSELATLTHRFQTELATGLSMLLSQRKNKMSHRLQVWTLTARGEAQSVVQGEQLCYACQHGATLLPVYQRCWQSNAPRVCQWTLAGCRLGLGSLFRVQTALLNLDRTAGLS